MSIFWPPKPNRTLPVSSVCCGRLKVWAYSRRSPRWSSRIHHKANACARTFRIHCRLLSALNFLPAEVCTKRGQAWGSIRTGEKAFDQIYGYDFWEFCRRNPKAGEVFNEAMGEVRRGTSPAVNNSYDWSRFAIIADIGGGLGVQLANILDAFPSCRGILFDQPQVLKQAASHERIERISGDFFQHVPTGADVYLLNGIIHDWTDSEALAILGKVRQAMKAGARLAVLDDIIPETPQFSFGKWLDLLMLTIPGGRERTEIEFRKLLSSAGFDLEEVIVTRAPLSILLAKTRETV